jgi:two-component system, cell cycle sensor histidine kinase and response regulator CckA
MVTPSHRLSPSVLIVDDDAAVRWLMARVLKDEGYRVILAEDGLVAWKLLQRANGSIDAVVTDVVMPGMDGIELASRIAALPQAPPLVITSAYPYDRAVRDHPFLPKPFRPEQLATLVGRVLCAMVEHKVG